ncbi:MAG: TonB-dependent receptor [Lewinellaceae bacterium]|nr:TonB-dependent receptor [Lewinellaceae bacterium]
MCFKRWWTQPAKFFLPLLLLCIALACSLNGRAQSPDTFLLPQIVVSDAFAPAAAQWKADSIPSLSWISAAQQLQWQGPVQIRSNGPGLLATASLRGAGPSHTPVVWEDLNLQSPMNGVFDLNLLPMWPGDRLLIEYGGQSAGLSSGAMSGSIRMTPGAIGANRNGGFLSLGAGSFDRTDARAAMRYGGNLWQATTRGAWLQARNNFPYRNITQIGSAEERQVHARQQQADLQQFLQWKMTGRDRLEVSVWALQAKREIPPSMTAVPDDSHQSDAGIRSSLRWTHSVDSSRQWRHRLAFLDEYIDFFQKGTTDTNHSRSWLGSSVFSAQLRNGYFWKAGVNLQKQSANTSSYTDTSLLYQQWRTAAHVYVEKNGRRSVLGLAARQEWVQDQRAPFTASVLWRWKPVYPWVFKLFGSRNFTLPTFNDRFWNQLGNPDLKPEKGYSADLTLSRKIQFGEIEAGFQNMLLDDWILWQPGADGLFRPKNLRQVWSRGVFVQTRGQHNIGKWNLVWNVQGQYNVVTNTRVYDNNIQVLHRQLPYTPRFSASITTSVQRAGYSLMYLHQITGSRYTTADESQQLPAFSTGTLVCSMALGKQWHVEFRLENCWNTAYQVVAFRPMPGRNWHAGVAYRF